MPVSECRIEQTPGQRDFKKEKNPILRDELLKIVEECGKPKDLYTALVLTGGEPLLQVDFLKSFLPAVKQKGWTVYLETNGTLPNNLAEVIDYTDIIALDIKLPSATGLTNYFKEHELSLKTAAYQKVFVKIVYTAETKAKEVAEAAALVSNVDAEIPLVLQPAAPAGKIRHLPPPELAFSLQAVARRKLKNVRVIPQMHKLLGVL